MELHRHAKLGLAGRGACRFIENDDASGEGVRDGGGNELALASPFAATQTCADFRMAAPGAAAYGHLAPGRG